MKKTYYTPQDLLEIDPSLSPGEVRKALDILNAVPDTLQERWAAENDMIAETMFTPLVRDRDGLTPTMREVNAFAEARGLPTPFPPK
jgi:hypothetical protein